MATHGKFPLEKLPLELICSIASHLDIHSLRTLLITSPYICSLAVLIVYNRNVHDKFFYGVPGLRVAHMYRQPLGPVDEWLGLSTHHTPSLESIKAYPLRIIENQEHQLSLFQEAEHRADEDFGHANGTGGCTIRISGSDSTLEETSPSRQEFYKRMDHLVLQFGHSSTASLGMIHAYGDWKERLCRDGDITLEYWDILCTRRLLFNGLRGLESLDLSLSTDFIGLTESHTPDLKKLCVYFYDNDRRVLQRRFLIDRIHFSDLEVFTVHFSGYQPVIGDDVVLREEPSFKDTLFELSHTSLTYSAVCEDTVKYTAEEIQSLFRMVQPSGSECTRFFSKIVLKGLFPGSFRVLDLSSASKLQMVDCIDYGAKRLPILRVSQALRSFIFTTNSPDGCLPHFEAEAQLEVVNATFTGSEAFQRDVLHTNCSRGTLRVFCMSHRPLGPSRHGIYGCIRFEEDSMELLSRRSPHLSVLKLHGVYLDVLDQGLQLPLVDWGERDISVINLGIRATCLNPRPNFPELRSSTAYMRLFQNMTGRVGLLSITQDATDMILSGGADHWPYENLVVYLDRRLQVGKSDLGAFSRAEFRYDE